MIDINIFAIIGEISEFDLFAWRVLLGPRTPYQAVTIKMKTTESYDAERENNHFHFRDCSDSLSDFLSDSLLLLRAQKSLHTEAWGLLNWNLLLLLFIIIINLFIIEIYYN